MNDLKDKELVIFDLETTGLDPYKSRIFQRRHPRQARSRNDGGCFAT